MQNNFISITDLSKDDILSLLHDAARFEANPNQRLLEGKVVATLFFEPSTRTRLSFETAANRLGALPPLRVKHSRIPSRWCPTTPTSSSCVTTSKEQHAMPPK